MQSNEKTWVSENLKEIKGKKKEKRKKQSCNQNEKIWVLKNLWGITRKRK